MKVYRKSLPRQVTRTEPRHSIDMQLRPGLFVLLLVCAAQSLAAEPALYSRESQEGVRAILLQNATIERGGNRPSGAQFVNPASGERRMQDNVFPNIPNAMGARISEADPLPPESVKRTRGLSAEERRTLRRQIDEVGHDIYAPRR